ncbi:cytochrome P450 [Microbacterium petrolearium]|jgi:fatty-acid peroxygenase
MTAVIHRQTAAPIPRVRGDATLALLAEGYGFGARRFDRLASDAFRTRLLGMPATFVRGPEAARFFAEGDRFSRTAAMPASVLHSLQDEGSVQTLAGDAHRTRKALFLELLEPAGRERMARLVREEWDAALPAWERTDMVRLHEVVAEVLTRAACRWAGLPLDDDTARARTEEFLAMLDGAGGFGPRNWRGRLRRRSTERWAQELVRDARDGSRGAVVGRLIAHRDADGRGLDDEVAAVELINLLRPTVAVGRFAVFAALALHRHPSWAERFRAGDEEHLRGFVQEVRRTAPFFPLVAGRATHELEWRGERFAPGALVALDIFATHRDPALWPEPLRFRPERHDPAAGPDDRRAHAANALIAQGAGDDLATTHRCPGEPLAIELLEEIVRLLTQRTAYEVPPQDLGVDLRRFPTLPRSGFLMSRVRRA